MSPQGAYSLLPVIQDESRTRQGQIQGGTAPIVPKSRVSKPAISAGIRLVSARHWRRNQRPRPGSPLICELQFASKGKWRPNLKRASR
ncbi:hypothetical protein BDV28DRAFT_133810 [Aspergillus coremiiformis]|uniref:Uncharacterized protein n=1 Tax=Aspergillus coremiiformis TaxID=138285 RepID=A0A5N6Z7B9_9EURO|nr:hypothetical protein BDV28DRAFT_133810 [Aspergillus coremiiformis]